MKIRHAVASAGLVASGVFGLSPAPAQAFSFQTNYTASLSGSNAAKGDIFLNSVTLESGQVISNFSLINAVNIVQNDLYTGGNTGAASADIGDLATTGVKQERLTNEGAKAVLNNLNLNNIIDTEDTGKFTLDLHFEKAVDNIFLWERGMNSKLDIQALDANGSAIGNLLKLANSSTWNYAGFSIDTQEISGAQKVGSIGLSLADFGLTGGSIRSVRVISEGTSYNGPDFKLVGGAAVTAKVPEPSSWVGLGALVAGALLTRCRQPSQAA